MWFRDVLCVCFVALLAPKIEANALLDSKTRNHTKPEALFADVIKNISRVNNELQSLIKNYEQFKKTHTSQEDFDAEKTLSSDSEGGRVNRNSKTNKRKPPDMRTTNSYQTELIYVEDEAEMSSETENSSEIKTSSKKQKSDEVETRHVEVSKNLTENTVKNKQKVQTTTTESKITTNKMTTDASANKAETETNNQEFSAIHDNMKIKTDRLKRILLEAYQESNQTKYTENEKETKYLGGDTSKDSSKSEISAESKRHTGEIKEEIDPKKPQERAMDEKQVAVTAGIYLRSLLRQNTTTTTKKPGNEFLESTENDEDLSKDVFKTNVLRQAYGDACLKLVIRKCHKACKSASTIACRAAIKCKAEFKTYFKEKAKDGCLEQFRSTSLRRINDPKSIAGGIITQEGYLSVACQTPIRRNLVKLKPATNNTDTLNILRDKYERACTKISQKKCTTACHNALDSSCDKHECKKTLKKNFKKHCRTQCKRFYSSKSKSSGSDDDDDDDDDSDSDDNSDSDDDSDGDSSDDDDASSKDKKKI